MANILVLSTNWSNIYWQQNGCAPYKGFKYNSLLNWDSLSNKCPLSAIGYYRDHPTDRCSINTNFEYIRINGMRYDEFDVPLFDFEFIQSSNSSSLELYRKLNQGVERNLFTSLSINRIQVILKQLNENPPSNWLNEKLPDLHVNEPIKKNYNNDWKNFIGNYFTDLLSTDIGNDAFEDRIANLLIALGFNLTQMGHRLVGAYPDGKAVLDDFIFVYDCKNSSNYYPIQDDALSMNEYKKNEININPNAHIFPVFIAKSFSSSLNPNFKYIDVENLLYLLYKKISLGYKFRLGHIKNILNSGKQFSKEIIDKEWIS